MNWRRYVIYISQLILILTSIYAAFNKEWGKMGLLLAAFALMWIPVLYTKWTKIKIPEGAALCYVLFILGCQWLGTYLRFYDYFFWWDILLHFTSGALLGYIGLIFLVTLDKNKVLFKPMQPLIIAVFALGISALGAIAWEIVEFTGDQLLGSFAQLGSLQDTMMDFIYATVGSILFVLHVIVSLKHPEGRKNLIKQLLEANH